MHLESSFVQMPDPLKNLSAEERAATLKATAEQAESDFRSAITTIIPIIEKSDPLRILAHFAYFDQLHSQLYTGASEYAPVGQAEIEWLQAMILRTSPAQTRESPKPEEITALNHALHRLKTGYGLKYMPTQRSFEEDFAAEITRQSTAFIRNEGYPSQSDRLLRELFRPLDSAYAERAGVSLSAIAEFLLSIREETENRMAHFREMIGSILREETTSAMIVRFATATQQDHNQVREAMRDFADNRERVRSAIFNYFTERAASLFIFSEDQLRKHLPESVSEPSAKKLFSGISLEWGSCHNCDAEALFLNNPVWRKPIIAALPGYYFFPLVGLVQSFGIEIIEGRLQEHRDLFERYSQKVRADYLERRTEEALKLAYPNAIVLRGVRWRDGSKQFETDFFVWEDSHALILECKSGRFRAKAQQGDINALRSEVAKLMGEAAQQALRAVNHFWKLRGQQRLVDRHGKVLDLNLSNLLRITPVVITLDYL